MKATTRNRVWAGLVVLLGVALGTAAFLRAKPAPVAPPPVEQQAQPAPAPVAAAPAAPASAAHQQAGSESAAPPPARHPLAASEAAAPLNESILMARLRSVAHSDFPLAVELARTGNRRFPDRPGSA